MPSDRDSNDAAELPKLRRFDILDVLGHGNTGTIYHVRAKVALGGLKPGDEAALKMLHPHLMEQEDARKAFLREARAGMQVRHPHLVHVHAVEEVVRGNERRRYLVLERVIGRNLRDLIDTEGLAQETTLRVLGRQIASALASLHEVGLLHLDVKPENITWDEERAVLMDLGFTRRNPEAAPAPGSQSFLESGGSDALFVGTPAYAAPELLGGKKATPTVDLFALGVTLYECATGVRPFGDERAFGLFEARRTAVVRKPSTIQPRLSAFFDAVVMRLLADDPAERFQSAAEVERIFARGERSTWWSNRHDTSAVLPLIHASALPFTGRREEMEWVHTAFHESRRSGTPRIVILRGKPGIGKSRLAMEIASQLRSRPEAPPFLYGRCLRLGRGSAFRAILNALARSLGMTPDEPPNDAVVHRLHTGLPPGAAQILVGLLRGEVYSREIRRRAFLDWFRALGREGPFFAFFDDLQVTGESMWTFMREVLDLEDVPALFILAHRDDIPERAARAREALLRSRRVREMEVHRLSRDEMATLFQKSFAPKALPSALAEDLLHVSRGMPGTAAALLRLLVRRGELEGMPGSLRPTSMEVTVPLTGDQAELLRAEIAEISEESRDLLLWAAMLTPPLDEAVLAEISEIDEGRVHRILEQLRKEGWLKIESGHYRFTLPRLREAAYRYVAPRGQRRRHARVYEYLTETDEGQQGRTAARAFHAHRAGMHVEAIELGLPLLETRVRGGAFEQAEQAVNLMRKHVDSIGWDSLSPAVKVRLRIAQAHIDGWKGDRESEADDLKEAGHIATEAGEPDLIARVHLALARHARSMGFASVARVHVQRARELVGKSAAREA